jgi:recombinational DNA repair protein (RecF pathway)
MERSGRNCFLYRTKNGAYFTVNLTQWQGERDTLTPITQQEAVDLFEGTLTEHHVKYAEAFPGVEVLDA